MSLFRDFWNDEAGVLISAETAAVGTIAVLGATAGLSVVSKSVNSEMVEVAQAIRSLNQSYRYPGFSSHGGTVYTSGSSYTQPPVEKALEEIRLDVVGAGAEGTAKPATPAKKKKKKVKDEDESAQVTFPRSDADDSNTVEADDAEAPAVEKNPAAEPSLNAPEA